MSIHTDERLRSVNGGAKRTLHAPAVSATVALKSKSQQQIGKHNNKLGIKLTICFVFSLVNLISDSSLCFPVCHCFMCFAVAFCYLPFCFTIYHCMFVFCLWFFFTVVLFYLFCQQLGKLILMTCCTLPENTNKIETEVYGLTRGVTGVQHSRVELLKLKWFLKQYVYSYC